MARQAQSCRRAAARTRRHRKDERAKHVSRATSGRDTARRRVARGRPNALRRSALSLSGGKRFGSGLANPRIFHICRDRRPAGLDRGRLHDGPVAQLDRASDFYSEGCRFDSCRDRQPFQPTSQDVGPVSASFCEAIRVARRSERLAGNSTRYATLQIAPCNTGAASTFALYSPEPVNDRARGDHARKSSGHPRASAVGVVAPSSGENDGVSLSRSGSEYRR